MILKAERFESFVLSIDAIHKSISKIKNDIVSDDCIKSVHTLWLYELLVNKDGLTPSELASKSKIDRSLVSREIRSLAKGGYINFEMPVGRRNYNSRITLTEKGKILAEEIADSAIRVQQSVSNDITDEELAVFYSVLDRILENLQITAKSEKGDLK